MKKKEFICPECNRCFGYKHHLERHTRKKKSCKNNIPKYSKNYSKIFQNGINHSILFQKKVNKNISNISTKNQDEDIKEGFKCNNCHKYYKYKYNLNKHFKKCKMNNDNNKKEILDIITKLNQKVSESGKKMDTIQKQFNQLIINNNNTYNTYNNNIIINTYGNENMSFLTDKFITDILKQGFPGLQEYIIYKYCNPIHHENLTIKYTNKRQKDIHIRKNNEWITADKNDVINEIYNWDTNVEEILNIYEKCLNLTDSHNLDTLQTNFVNSIEHIYDNEDSILLQKAKNNTLNKLYDCYVNNKKLYKIV